MVLLLSTAVTINSSSKMLVYTLIQNEKNIPGIMYHQKSPSQPTPGRRRWNLIDTQSQALETWKTSSSSGPETRKTLTLGDQYQLYYYIDSSTNSSAELSRRLNKCIGYGGNRLLLLSTLTTSINDKNNFQNIESVRGNRTGSQNRSRRISQSQGKYI